VVNEEMEEAAMNIYEVVKCAVTVPTSNSPREKEYICE